MKWQLNTYLYLFHGYTPSWVFNFIIFFIIIYYPNAEVDKKFFKSWDLHIPHWLRDLLWNMRAWSSETRFFFFPKFVESNQFLLEHIPWMNEFHDSGRPFKVAITTSAFFTSSFPAWSCSLMVSAFWIFTFFSWFLKVIFWSMFFPSNSLVKESNLIDVFREDTCSTSWFETESSMIFWDLTKFFLRKASSLISLWNWNLYAHVGVQSIFFREIIYF